MNREDHDNNWAELIDCCDDSFNWKKWFAWYPVKIDDIDGNDAGYAFFNTVWHCRLKSGKNYYVLIEYDDDDGDDLGTPLSYQNEELFTVR